MAFKLYSEAQNDIPYLVCDVCGAQIRDLWNSKATGSPVHGQTVNVTVHHPECVAQGAISMPLIDFLRLFVIKNCVGDIGSNGQTNTAHVPFPVGKGFEA